MKRSRPLSLFLLAVLCLPAFLPRTSFAQSIWGMEGIGLPIRGYDLAARGAGSTGIGVADRFGMSSVNPALIAWARLPQASIGFVTENRWITSGGSSSRRGSSGLTGLNIVVPLPERVRLGLAYRDILDGSYQVEQDLDRDREDAEHRTYTGTGGVGEIAATLALRDPAGFVSFGIGMGFRGGTLRDRREGDFANGVYIDTKDLLRTRLHNGRALSLGLQLRPLPSLTFGGAWTGSVTYDLQTIWTSTSSEETRSSSRLRIPASYGLGASGMLGPRARLAFDWNHDPWGGATFHADSPAGGEGGFGQFRDFDRVGVGLELLPGETAAKDPLLRRSVWRAGLSWGRLPYTQSDGARITEWAVTGGLGLPVQVDRGYVNLLLEAGRTGSLATDGLRETFLRLGLGVTFGRLVNQF